MALIQNFLVRNFIRLKGLLEVRSIRLAARNIKKSQLRLLNKILKKNSETLIGERFGFLGLKTYKDFQKKVPLHDYEMLRGFIETQEKENSLTLHKEPALFYAMTSGTTGKPKYIPVLKSSLKMHSRSKNLFLYYLIKSRPKLLDGKILAVVSPAVEGRFPSSGKAFGATSGHMYNNVPSIIRNKYIVPPSVFSIEDYDLKYEVILRLALVEKDTTYLTTANPSTLARLSKILQNKSHSLIRDIQWGGFTRYGELPAEVIVDLKGKLDPNPFRAKELREALEKKGRLWMQDIWPSLQAVGVWTGGSCGIFLEQLRGEFSSSTIVRDIGYLASEMRGTTPISSLTHAGVPSFQDLFFEFVEKNDWENGNQKFKGLWELEDKKQYYVFITSDYGLYRYNMNDIVSVDGFFAKIPMLKFIQKGKGVTSITGEKLYESQVIGAVSKFELETGLGSSFFMAVADEQAERYTLYYEPLKDLRRKTSREVMAMEKRLDMLLMEINNEYEAKRKSGRLKPLRVGLLVPETFDLYKNFCIKAGQREGQFKIVALNYLKDLKFDFEECLDLSILDKESIDFTETVSVLEDSEGGVLKERVLRLGN